MRPLGGWTGSHLGTARDTCINFHHLCPTSLLSATSALFPPECPFWRLILHHFNLLVQTRSLKIEDINFPSHSPQNISTSSDEKKDTNLVLIERQI
jgi:hypothetical protein